MFVLTFKVSILMIFFFSKKIITLAMHSVAKVELTDEEKALKKKQLEEKRIAYEKARDLIFKLRNSGQFYRFFSVSPNYIALPKLIIYLSYLFIILLILQKDYCINFSIIF